MPTFTPVDHDPFADQTPAQPAPSAPPPPTQATVAGPKLTPVDNDPFADTPGASIPTMVIKRGMPDTGLLPGKLKLKDDIAPRVPDGAPRPLAPGEFVLNPDGSWSSEITATVSDPALNSGKSTVVPTLWLVGGQPMRVDEDTAASLAIQSKLDFPPFESQEEAEAFATKREENWQKIKPEEAGKVPPLWDVAGTFPIDQPGQNYGNLLPFSEDAKTHDIRWGIGQNVVVRSLARGFDRFVDRMENREALTDTEPLTGDELGTLMGFGGLSRTKQMFAPTGHAATKALRRAEEKETRAIINKAYEDARTQAAADRKVEERLNQDLAGNAHYQPHLDYDVPTNTGPHGVPTLRLPTGPADELVGNLDRMRASGKPANIMHAAGPNTLGEGGRISREPGTAQGIIRGEAKVTDAGAADRHRADIGTNLAKGETSSSYHLTEQLLHQRSVESKPLYEKAMAGGSIAPLEQQFTEAWRQAGRALREAEQAVEVAKSQLTAAQSRTTVTRGNVYSMNANKSRVREAEIGVHAAEEQAAAARQDAAEIKAMMERARNDRLNNAPGAVWNLRIQRILDRPDARRAAKLGMKIQADEAAAAGKRFDPFEIAMTEEGEIIRVPNMRTLNVIKKGLDSLYQASLDEYGRPNEEGVGIDRMRRSLLEQMDAINPDYKVARAAWAERSQSLDALNWVKGIPKISPEQVAKEFAQFSPSEQEFARIGVANRLLDEVGDTSFGADEAKRIFKTPNMRDRLQPMFHTEEDFVNYVHAVADERRMYDVNTRLIKNSETAARMREDQAHDLSGAAHIAHGAVSLADGKVLRSVGHGLRAARDFFRGQPSGAMDEAIARTLTSRRRSPIVVGGKLVYPPEQAPDIVTPRGTLRPQQPPAPADQPFNQ